jgi:hypothetical protein
MAGDRSCTVDRREALKKLGGGTVVVVGASTIASSPAFAYDQPTPGADAGLVFVEEIGSDVTFNIDDGSATCPGSATSTTASVFARSTRLTEVNAVPDPFQLFPFFLPTEFRLLGNTLPQTTTASSFTLGKFITGFPAAPSLGFANGDSFQAEITITFRCTYSDGTTRDRDVTTTVTATRSVGTWSVV